MDLVTHLIPQMRRRGLGPDLTAFLKQWKLNAQSFLNKERNLRRALEAKRFSEDDLLQLFFSKAMFGHKRVMLLRKDPLNIEALGEPIPDGMKISFFPLTGRGIKRPVGSKKMPGFYMGMKTVAGLEVHSFATVRVVTQPKELERDALAEGAKKRFDSIKIVAKMPQPYRCFDHLVKVDGRYLLLVDHPPGVTSDEYLPDIRRYREYLSSEQDVGGSPWVDLWPAVKAMYDDPTEGLINAVEFESNNRAHQSGKYGRLQMHDYRQLPYHAAGRAAGQVEVFAIAVRWDKPSADLPYVVLPGNRGMLQRTDVNGEPFPPLTHAEFVLPTTAAAFQFVVKRLLKRVP